MLSTQSRPCKEPKNDYTGRAFTRLQTRDVKCSIDRRFPYCSLAMRILLTFLVSLVPRASRFSTRTRENARSATVSENVSPLETRASEPCLCEIRTIRETRPLPVSLPIKSRERVRDGRHGDHKRIRLAAFRPAGPLQSRRSLARSLIPRSRLFERRNGSSGFRTDTQCIEIDR